MCSPATPGRGGSLMSWCWIPRRSPSHDSKWKERLAIKMWSGWPTFPQVYVKGKLLGGHDTTAKAIEDGSLRRMLPDPSRCVGDACPDAREAGTRTRRRHARIPRLPTPRRIPLSGGMGEPLRGPRSF